MARTKNPLRLIRAPVVHRADIVVTAYFTLADGTRILMRSIVNPTDSKPICHYRGVIRGKAY